MKLAEYLKKHGLTHEQFAVQVGVSRPVITIMINGRKNPSARLIKKIQDETNGEVTFEDLYNPEAPSRMKNRDNEHTTCEKT